jgi:hypothetical protein
MTRSTSLQDQPLYLFTIAMAEWLPMAALAAAPAQLIPQHRTLSNRSQLERSSELVELDGLLVQPNMHTLKHCSIGTKEFMEIVAL